MNMLNNWKKKIDKFNKKSKFDKKIDNESSIIKSCAINEYDV